MLTVERLKSLLTYDPDAGRFFWKASPRRRAIDGEAGTVNTGGYRQICIDQKIYKAHRLAWFYAYGVWPKNQIDHINGQRDDNRLGNLREADFSQNQANAKKRALSENPAKGVTLHKASGLWNARVTKGRRVVYCEYFSSIDDAKSAYKENAEKYFGVFARSG